jgi:hypothetical protein
MHQRKNKEAKITTTTTTGFLFHCVEERKKERKKERKNGLLRAGRDFPRRCTSKTRMVENVVKSIFSPSSSSTLCFIHRNLNKDHPSRHASHERCDIIQS